jgi:hypothetical protein
MFTYKNSSPEYCVHNVHQGQFGNQLQFENALPHFHPKVERETMNKHKIVCFLFMVYLTMPTLADRECRLVSATNPHGR